MNSGPGLRLCPWILVAALFVGSAVWAFPHAQGYHARLADGSQVDAYVVKPSALVEPLENTFWGRLKGWFQSRPNGNFSYRLLGHAAAFIDQQSKALGHVNRSTGFYHRLELAALRAGRWPMVIITEAGKPENVLLTVAIAIPHNREALPFKMRFYCRGAPGLPDRYPPVAVGMHNFFENESYLHPVVGFDHTQGWFRIVPDLSVVTSMLPWAIGDQAELKFLMQRPGASASLSALAHALIVGYGLHRFTAVRLPKFMVEQQVDFMREPTIRAEFERRISEIEASRMADLSGPPEHRQRDELFLRRFFDAFRSELFSPQGFQKTTAVSTLFAQVSERESETEGSFARLFINRFRFPRDPYHDFIEQAAFGTDGIRTRIFALSLENFDLDMMEGLNPRTQDLAEKYTLQRMAPIGGSCPTLLTDFDSRILLRAYRGFRQN